mmetsp:Transcript_5261/g.9451  ORF Transcript_5261/g.9451 Transcript_5261/m.9451 type:complete len:235 (-) Transcript_5261:5128-5832(-)
MVPLTEPPAKRATDSRQAQDMAPPPATVANSNRPLARVVMVSPTVNQPAEPATALQRNHRGVMAAAQWEEVKGAQLPPPANLSPHTTPGSLSSALPPRGVGHTTEARGKGRPNRLEVSMEPVQLPASQHNNLPRLPSRTLEVAMVDSSPDTVPMAAATVSSSPSAVAMVRRLAAPPPPPPNRARKEAMGHGAIMETSSVGSSSDSSTDGIGTMSVVATEVTVTHWAASTTLATR